MPLLPLCLRPKRRCLYRLTRAAGLPPALFGPGSSIFAADRRGQAWPVVFASVCRKKWGPCFGGACLSSPVESPGGTLLGLYAGIRWTWDCGQRVVILKG